MTTFPQHVGQAPPALKSYKSVGQLSLLIEKYYRYIVDENVYLQFNKVADTLIQLQGDLIFKKIIWCIENKIASEM